MIIVALADLHNDISSLREISDALSTADVVLLAGDLTHFGRKEAAARVVGAVRKYNDHILAVPGNCDYPEVEAYLTSEGINLHRKSVTMGGVAFMGVGGSLHAPAATPYVFSDDQLLGFLMEAISGLSSDLPKILVSHQPPYGTSADLASTGHHVGSQSVRAFIEKFQPMICFTGHIHEGQGIDSIGETKVINPGPLKRTGYAYATIEQQEIKALEVRHF